MSAAPSPRTWVITGSSSGIGRCLAEQLLEQGYRVAGTARDVAALADLVQRYPNRFRADTLDLTDPDAIHHLLDGVFADFSRVDVVVSNAAAGLTGAAEEVSDQQLTDLIATNLTGSIRLAREVIPRLRAQGGGRIVQVTSIVPVAIPGLSIYHATKWGIEGFWEAVIPEIASFGIGVTMVQPGSTRTGFSGRAALAPAIPAYRDTPVAARRARARGGSTANAEPPGDPVKMARAIIECARLPTAPRRLTLGSDAYRLISAALHSQLSELEAARETASSTDIDVVAGNRTAFR